MSLNWRGRFDRQLLTRKEGQRTEEVDGQERQEVGECRHVRHPRLEEVDKGALWNSRSFEIYLPNDEVYLDIAVTNLVLKLSLLLWGSVELPLVQTRTEDVDCPPDVDPECEGERRLHRLEALVLHDPRLAGPQPESAEEIKSVAKILFKFLYDLNVNMSKWMLWCIFHGQTQGVPVWLRTTFC